ISLALAQLGWLRVSMALFFVLPTKVHGNDDATATVGVGAELLREDASSHDTRPRENPRLPRETPRAHQSRHDFRGARDRWLLGCNHGLPNPDAFQRDWSGTPGQRASQNSSLRAQCAE